MRKAAKCTSFTDEERQELVTMGVPSDVAAIASSDVYYTLKSIQAAGIEYSVEPVYYNEYYYERFLQHKDTYIPDEEGGYPTLETYTGISFPGDICEICYVSDYGRQDYLLSDNRITNIFLNTFEPERMLVCYIPGQMRLNVVVSIGDR